MMMKKKFVAVALSAVCLLSAVGCGQQSASTASSASSVSSSVASSASASQVMDAEDYLSGISGTYVELFPEMAKSEYRNLWIDAATPLVGEDNAESATDMLLGMCMAEPYGEEAVEKYAADPDSTAFNCYFLGGFLFYQSEDADSGEFTYFAFAPDTMETTYHLEFRYAEDLDDLQSWYEGNYAYWNAAAIAEDYDQATMENVIELFVTENLSEAE